ncbi:bypass of stop codon protein 1-like [Drosophila subobscura]|uniref:bypass of stop codon protein 1-like n=1 Tax=Drosophila subobscura TaxID=7241 RepID=UPI00155A177C|nr:bypass of stop codon protein 1-like [Drosophila subobscura]
MLRILLCLALGILGCQAACNVCNPDTGTICLTATNFTFCDGVSVIGSTAKCPDGYYCTQEIKFCQSRPELAACSAETSSSTTESTTESTTSSTESSSSSTATSSSTTAPTTSTTSTPTTVDPAIIDMCQAKASTGRYTNPNDATCRSYVICFYRGSVWLGNVWQCPTAKPYFSSITSACGTIPSICV